MWEVQLALRATLIPGLERRGRSHLERASVAVGAAVLVRRKSAGIITILLVGVRLDPS
jgi:hypothetical protein